MPRRYVLVHGGWHGAWCWHEMAPHLRAAGHDVRTPTLTGLGEQAHLVRPEVDLEHHVADILVALEQEDLHEVVLVGHSYGGMVIAGVADRARERVAHVVYLDAFLPHDGESLFAILPDGRREVYEEAAREHGDGWLVPAPPAAAMGITDRTAAAWVQTHMTPQPIATFVQGLKLTAPPGTHTPCTYVRCTEGPLVRSFASSDERAQAAGWPRHELPTGHDAMLTMPQRTAELLAGIS